MSDKIQYVNGYAKDAYVYYPVVIIGAGESGIAMGCRLKDLLGHDQFRIFERQSGVGGTWWINRYPGVACDVWTSFYPPGPEIVRYLQDVCVRYGIMDKIQLNTDVEECRWLEEEQQWEVTLKHLYPGVGDLSSKDRLDMVKEHGEDKIYTLKEKIRAKVVCSAVGGLVEPKKWPEHITGRDVFKGDIFHSARWDYNVDLRDKNVLVIGTGCSAAQFVPQLVKSPYNAKSVTQLMRSPPWVVPRVEPPVNEEQWCKWSSRLFANVPLLAWIIRISIFLLAESHFFKLFGGSEFHAKQRKIAEADMLKHMRKKVPAKYHEMLTPNYSVGCKRRIFDGAWFPSLNDSRIELCTLPLSSLKPQSAVLGPQIVDTQSGSKESAELGEFREIPADVIVLANGFDVFQWLHPLKVIGRNGQDLVEVMKERGGAQAYQGTAMDGFPNFFMIFGPNTVTGHSSVILASENMVNYSLKFIRKILRGDATTVEVKKEAEMNYTKDIQAKLKDTVWMKGGCSSWYFTTDGWNSTVLPYSQIWFTFRCMFPRWNDWDIQYTRKGKIKKMSKQLFGLIIVISFIIVTYQIRTRSYTLEKTWPSVRNFVSKVMESPEN